MSPGPASVDDDARAAELKAEWRRFVRDHHPDRGGDPEVFAAGLAAYRSGRHPLQAAEQTEQFITMHRSPRGLRRVRRWARRRWDGWTRPPRVE